MNRTSRTTGQRTAPRLALCAIAAVGAVSLAACGDDEEGARDTLSVVQERGYATFGLEAQYEPFGFRDADNNIIGYDIELGNAIGEIIGVEMRPVDTGWAAVIQTMYDGGFDFILGGMTATAERAERVDFGVAYAEQASAVLVRADDPITTDADFDGRIMAAGEGTPSVKMLEDHATNNSFTYDGEIQQFDDDAVAFEALSAERIDAYATSYVSLVPLMDARPGEFKAVLFKPEGYPDFYAAMAFRQEDDTLREAVDAAILQLKEDGTLAELQMKWFGIEMETPNTPPPL